MAVRALARASTVGRKSLERPFGCRTLNHRREKGQRTRLPKGGPRSRGGKIREAYPSGTRGPQSPDLFFRVHAHRPTNLPVDELAPGPSLGPERRRHQERHCHGFDSNIANSPPAPHGRSRGPLQGDSGRGNEPVDELRNRDDRMDHLDEGGDLGQRLLGDLRDCSTLGRIAHHQQQEGSFVRGPVQH